jgi:hypothetical protein
VFDEYNKRVGVCRPGFVEDESITFRIACKKTTPPSFCLGGVFTSL